MEIELTNDGSPTLFVPELNEHYHSTKGAVTESQHIFIRMGLEESAAPAPRVLEIGFGTGLNAFLTLLATNEIQKNIHYTSIELHPLQEEIIRRLDYPPYWLQNGQRTSMRFIGRNGMKRYRSTHISSYIK